MIYLKKIGEQFLLRTMQADDAEQLGTLQKTIFPNLSADELITAEHYRNYVTAFAQGQLVILDGKKVIATSCSMITDFDFNQYQHSFKETIGDGTLNNHNPKGEWLYQLDIGVHPNYRRQGLAKELYSANHFIAKELGLKGQLTVGMLNGYGAVCNSVAAEEYYAALIAGKRNDPTVSMQMNIGFEPLGLIPNYLDDPTCGNYGVLLKLPIEQAI